jgi:hypothetical protein
MGERTGWYVPSQGLGTGMSEGQDSNREVAGETKLHWRTGS